MIISIHRIEFPPTVEEATTADAILAVDANGAISCTKNRHGEIGVVSTQHTPETLLEWIRSQCRLETQLRQHASR